MLNKRSAFPIIALIFCGFIAATATFADVLNVGDVDGPEDQSAGFYYTVQKGDTLWDLSKKFYDSEWVWPAMWGQNDQLTNPHWIYPGQRLRLYQKTDKLAVQDQPEPVMPPPPEEVIEEAPVEEAAPAPAPELIPEPEETPPPVPVYYLMDEITRVGFLKKLPQPAFFKRIVDPLKIGSVFKVESTDDQQMISQGDTIYIEPQKETSFIIGSRYFIYKPIQRINDTVTGNYAGHQYRIAGIAEITSTQPGYAVAEVIKSYLTINIGDSIMPLQKRSAEIPLSPEPSGLTGRVVINEDHNQMSADQSIVFIDKGEKDGIMPGQRYNIYSQKEEKVGEKTVALPPVIYGKLLVLLVEESTATAIITSSSQAVLPGATFSSPTI